MDNQSTIPPSPEPLLPQGPKPEEKKPFLDLDLNPENRSKILVLSFITVLVIITLIALTTTLIVLRNQSTSPATKPPPPPETPVSIPVLPSPFSTDSAVLQIRNHVNALISSTSAVSFIEPEISPPGLDLNLRIQSP